MPDKNKHVSRRDTEDAPAQAATTYPPMPTSTLPTSSAHIGYDSAQKHGYDTAEQSEEAETTANEVHEAHQARQQSGTEPADQAGTGGKEADRKSGGAK